MEDTLRVIDEKDETKKNKCLNPCFNGRYSQRYSLNFCNRKFIFVLILVLMEDTLRVNASLQKEHKESLNPCFNGRYSQSLEISPHTPSSLMS